MSLYTKVCSCGNEAVVLTSKNSTTTGCPSCGKIVTFKNELVLVKEQYDSTIMGKTPLDVWERLDAI